MQGIVYFLNKRKSIYQKQIVRAERQERHARELLENEPDREDVKEDLQAVIRLKDRCSSLVDFIEELQEIFFEEEGGDR